jgi:hypothetical protein
MADLRMGIEAEFTHIMLGDARLEERARLIAARIQAAPDSSFPDQMNSVAEREALYRFFANDAVTVDGLIQGHVQQTHQRMANRTKVRILHDTTDFKFSGDREGLGTLKRGAKGFFAHVALAVGGDEVAEPLGVLGVRPHVLKEVAARRKKTRSQRVMATQAKERGQKLSSRWEKLACQVSKSLPTNVHAIHIMDQEADDYVLLAELHKAKLSFVVRVSPTRLLRWSGGPTVRDALASEPARLFRTVSMNPRAKKASSNHPARAERNAQLVVRWGKIELSRGRLIRSDVDALELHAVHVFEPNPPAGEEAIEWMLFTSEPIESLDDASAIIDDYRTRWMIEEYFKALKTGCAFEKRQLTTYDGLLRALGLFIPAAWHLLLVRYLGRAPRQRPATAVFDAEQLLLLRALLEKRRYSLGVEPTVRDVMLGIAALGGHIKNNGDPGWIVLGRGFTKFLDAEEVWRLARRSDQS